MSKIKGEKSNFHENKSPGSDGFSGAFFKEFWYLLKNEVLIMFGQFHGNEVLPRCFLSYFVALISKVKNPFGLKDYKLISPIGKFI